VRILIEPDRKSTTPRAHIPPTTTEVRDANGQQLAYAYHEEEPGRRSVAKLLSKNETRKIASKIAKKS
jgi:YD repeat-containing protein